jgi:putative transposase
MYVIRPLTEVLELTKKWVREYNEECLHHSLDDLTPCEYRDKHKQLEYSNLGATKIRRFT